VPETQATGLAPASRIPRALAPRGTKQPAAGPSAPSELRLGEEEFGVLAFNKPPNRQSAKARSRRGGNVPGRRAGRLLAATQFSVTNKAPGPGAAFKGPPKAAVG